MHLTRAAGAIALVAGLGVLTGCESVPGELAGITAPPERPAPLERSRASIEAEAYYAAVQRSLLANGLLRTDGGGPDTLFNARMLARNFLRIALYREYTERTGRLWARESGSVLHRWEQPIRYRLSFGATVEAAKRQRDRRELARFSARLQRLTGVGFSPTDSQEAANMHIFVLNEDERRALGPTLRQLVPGISTATVNSALRMNRDTYCLAFAVTPQDSPVYTRAIIIIRAEHPDLMRQACIHEEIAQAMGLPNDSPDARPSIFNDDGEFALLTTHDEMLLRILYDPRLRPGMTEAQARPIVERIATELVAGGV